MTQVEMVDIDIATQVLIIGGGMTAIKAASDIVSRGYDVVLAAKEAQIGENNHSLLAGLSHDVKSQLKELVEAVEANSRIDVRTNTTICGVSGVPGDFHVALCQGDETSTLVAGAIVVATDAMESSLHEMFGLTLGDTVLTQSQLEDALEGDAGQFAQKSIAFLAGLGQTGNPMVMERMFRSILTLQALEADTLIYVFTNDLKVAADGLERLFKEGRDKGAIYFKIEEPPKVSHENGAVLLSYFDQISRRELSLTPDLVVVEEAICASDYNGALADLIRIDSGPMGFLQKENVHRFPVQSNREGIFIAGQAKDAVALPLAYTDVANVVNGVANLLGNGVKKVPAVKTEVTADKCTICLTCYRSCPHGAVYWDGDKAVMSKIACQGCGICASECPMDAIQLDGYTDEIMKKEISASLANPEDAPTILAFCCQNSAYEAGQMAKGFCMTLPDQLKVVKVPCAGKVDIDYMLTALAEGADGVLVLACHTGNCKSEQGNTFAGWRVNEVHAKLAAIGIEKDRIRFATLASNMGADFARIVHEMQENLKELGLSPLRN